MRDGSLILNEGLANSSRNPGVQLALSGDLTSILTAQSQGLTAVTTTYANPADTVARMVPEDSQTAAVLIPGSEGTSKTPSFTAVGDNFIDVAPLGSPSDKGVPTSVEASQLSRALTLTEMTVRSDLIPGDARCQCQTGSDDLAFINVGYQIQGLNPAATTAGESLSNAKAFPQLGDTPQPIDSVDVAFINAYEMNNPLPATLKSGDVIQKVEQYLARLYKALDEPHQQLENALRGDPSGLEPDVRSTPDLFTTSAQDQTFGSFTPPFSSPNRAALGDPVATAQQAVSSKTDLKQAFSSFGTNLQKNQKRAQLTQEVANLNSDIASLNKRLADVTPTPGTVKITGNDNPETLKAQIAADQQSLAHKEAELNQLG